MLQITNSKTYLLLKNLKNLHVTNVKFKGLMYTFCQKWNISVLSDLDLNLRSLIKLEETLFFN
jgi:hypothetical protein